MTLKRSHQSLIIGTITLAIALYGGYQYGMHIWPNSELRFKAANYKDSGIRVAAVGDSITQGGPPIYNNNFSYPAYLQKLLGAEYIVGNFGVNGATAIHGNDNTYIDLRAYAYSQAFAPDIVLIMLGTNDSKIDTWNEQAYKDNYKALIQSYTALPSLPRVILMKPIPTYSDAWGIQSDIVDNNIQDIADQLGLELNLEVIDLNQSFVDRKDLYLDDLIHPNTKGNQHLAESIHKLVQW